MLKVKSKKRKIKKEDVVVTGRQPECTRCPLHKTSSVGEKNLVCLWGHGNSKSNIMLVGEAPGKDEILQEIPFIGEAGKLLDRYLLKAEINREKDVYITNTGKCRPPSNRTPKPLEIKACAPYLDYEIKQQNPKVIGALGAVALKRILGVEGITKLRGVPIWSNKYSCYCVPTWHPSFILRNGEEFQQTEQFLRDLKLIKQIGETGKTGRMGTKIGVCNTLGDVSRIFAELRTKKVVAVDTETVGNYLSGKIISVQFSWKPGEAWVLPFFKTGKDGLVTIWNEEDFAYIQRNLKVILENTDIKKVGQNIKYDYQFFKLYDINLHGVIFDTMLADYLLNENDKKGHGLRDLGLRFTDMGDYSLEFYEVLGLKEKDIDENTYSCAPFKELCRYGGKDADCTFRAFCVLFPRIKKLGLLLLLSKVMVPLSFALADMELTGVAVDVEYYKELAKEYENKIEKVSAILNEFPGVKELEVQQGKPVNFRSTNQLKILFYDILKLPILKYTSNKKRKNKVAKNPSTDKEVLAQLAEMNEIPKVLQEHRTLSKFLSTNIKPIPDLVKEDGRLHTSYHQTRTTTGRLASSDPNLQNIPKKEPELAKQVRNGFLASKGCHLIEADFAQIEFRLLLNESGDEQGRKDIESGLDIHKTVASIGWNIPYEEVTKEIREKAKTIVYSIIFGKSKENLATETNLSVEQVEQVFDAIFKRYPRVLPYITSKQRQGESVGIVVNWIGRRRHLDDSFKSNVEVLIAEAKRQAVNSPIQGGAHDIVSIATLRVRKAIREKGLKSKLVMTTHDALIADVPDDETEVMSHVMKTEMERPIPRIRVPMTVDLTMGKRLGEMKELKLEEIKQ